ncbi:MAG: diamine N-acetyltransferase [Acidobacteriota bacterium]|nr:diamine N-acetyltransferase [Acidobacteriota bacterium]
MAADTAALAALAERTFVEAFGAQNRPEDLALHVRRSYGEAIQLEEILDPGFVTFVAEGEGQLQAFAQLALGAAPASLSGARPIEIRRFYVDAPWHGRGLAQRLMAAALDFAAEAGADVVWLGVWEENPRGIAFYAKCGFAPVGHHTFVLGNDPQRDVLMARSVDRAGA